MIGDIFPSINQQANFMFLVLDRVDVYLIDDDTAGAAADSITTGITRHCSSRGHSAC